MGEPRPRGLAGWEALSRNALFSKAKKKISSKSWQETAFCPRTKVVHHMPNISWFEMLAFCWIGADLMTFRWQKKRNGTACLLHSKSHIFAYRKTGTNQIFHISIKHQQYHSPESGGFGCAFWWNKPRGRSFTHVLPSPCDHSADIATDSNRPESAMKLSVLGVKEVIHMVTWPHMCQGRSTPYIGGMVIPPLIGNPYHQQKNPDQWGYDYSLP